MAKAFNWQEIFDSGFTKDILDRELSITEYKKVLGDTVKEITVKTVREALVYCMSVLIPCLRKATAKAYTKNAPSLYARTGGILNTFYKINENGKRVSVSMRSGAIVQEYAMGYVYKLRDTHYHPSLFGEYKGGDANTLNILDTGYSWRGYEGRYDNFRRRKKGNIKENALIAARKNKQFRDYVNALNLDIIIDFGDERR